MSPARFEPAIPATERLHSYALDRAATVVGDYKNAEAKDKPSLAINNTWCVFLRYYYVIGRTRIAASALENCTLWEGLMHLYQDSVGGATG
jgi:hypothetical protein